jgi:uncharacterized protein (TIGR01777 family)
MIVLIAGGTGMIGRAVSEELALQGHEAHTLTRSAEVAEAYPTAHLWDPGSDSLDLDSIATDAGGPIDVIINLAGSSISKMPWTTARKSDILQSRLESTGELTGAMQRAKKKPPLFLSGSAVGIYGSRSDETLTEKSNRGAGFLADVVDAWEAAAQAAPRGVKVVTLRTGIVLGPDGGALGPIKLLTKFFVSGPLAGGKQWWPWISLRDEARAIVHLMTAGVTGPVNLVGPNPATANTLMRTLAIQMRRPFLVPAPGFAIRAALGEAGDEILLSSQKVIPATLEDSGFVFDDVTVGQALTSALHS